ncbi:MAG: M28 family peptidase [Bacteroidetes bacterium]|nr:M28 family peptidase [Bacteroidota bacterium]
MTRRVFHLCMLVCFVAVVCDAQTKTDRKTIKRLTTDITYLASDALEGRRTGSAGEQKAADYIATRYKKLKIAPYKGDYKLPFKFFYGKEISDQSFFKVGTVPLLIPQQAFPLPFSKNVNHISGDVLPDVWEHGNIWLVNLYSEKEDANDAHFDYEKAMFDRAKDAQKKGATAVVFYDGVGAKYPPKFNPHSELETMDIPVAFLSHGVFDSLVNNHPDGVKLSLKFELNKSERTGTNVAAWIDNKAPYTVILGAHFDHLGYGEDGNSLSLSKEIHNGADDNASGSAGLLELAARIKKQRLRNYNYLFVNFSGEELGLLGSKAFVKDYQIDSNHTAYMINMDMIGRLNDSTHALTVGGIGTSPVWSTFVSSPNKEFKIAIDSSGVGPSDHTSFYHVGIPVLFFFTGIHHDYHKPSDDADKINYLGEAKVLDFVYSIVSVMDTRLKPKFTPTRQTTVGKVRFKVTLGIMPDYSFQEGGVRVDDVADEKPAKKAGIKAGDIIIQLGDTKILGMQSYMEALGKAKSGQTTTVTVLRNGKPVKLKVTF